MVIASWIFSVYLIILVDPNWQITPAECTEFLSLSDYKCYLINICRLQNTKDSPSSCFRDWMKWKGSICFKERDKHTQREKKTPKPMWFTKSLLESLLLWVGSAVLAPETRIIPELPQMETVLALNFCCQTIGRPPAIPLDVPIKHAIPKSLDSNVLTTGIAAWCWVGKRGICQHKRCLSSSMPRPTHFSSPITFSIT